MLTSMKCARFESIGVYLPANIVTTNDIIKKVPCLQNFDFARITGIKQRHIRTEDDTSYSMAATAAKNCLLKSRYDARDIDIIINASITRFSAGTVYMSEPPLSLLVKNKIGAIKALNFDITNACAGMMTGAYILFHMIKAGSVRNGMVVSGECPSYLLDTAIETIENVYDDQLASLTLGDSGAAFIMDNEASNTEGIDFVNFTTFARYADLCIAMPSKTSTGIAMYTKGAELNAAGSGEHFFRYILESVLKNNAAVSRKMYDYIIFHQVTVRNNLDHVRYAREQLHIDLPEALIYADRYGNTSSTSHLLALYQALKDNRIINGSRILFVPAASGLNLGVLSATIGSIGVGDGY